MRGVAIGITRMRGLPVRQQIEKDGAIKAQGAAKQGQWRGGRPAKNPL